MPMSMQFQNPVITVKGGGKFSPQSTLASCGVECLLRLRGAQVAESAELLNSLHCLYHNVYKSAILINILIL